MTHDRLPLEADPPFIIVKAGATKNRQDARQYVTADLAARLERHVPNNAPLAPGFAMPERDRVVDMFRADVAAARAACLAAARGDPQ